MIRSYKPWAWVVILGIKAYLSTFVSGGGWITAVQAVGEPRACVFRRVEGGWRIARRNIIRDQNVMLAKNVRIFL